MYVFSVVIRSGYGDPITGANVMQQKIAIWMKRLASERIGNRKLPTVDHRACGCCGQGWDVAGVAADFREKRLPPLCRGRPGLLRVARRSLGGAHKSGKVVNIGQSVVPGGVVRFGNRVAE